MSCAIKIPPRGSKWLSCFVVTAERSVPGQCPGGWHHSSVGAGNPSADDSAPAEPLGRALSGKNLNLTTSPPHLLWSVNQEFPTHSPPQGIPGAGGGWKFSGLTEALSPNHLSLIKYSEGQMSVSDILASCETEQYLAVCGTDGGSDTRLQESRSGLLKCLAHQRQVLHVCALWFF